MTIPYPGFSNSAVRVYWSGLKTNKQPADGDESDHRSAIPSATTLQVSCIGFRSGLPDSPTENATSENRAIPNSAQDLGSVETNRGGHNGRAALSARLLSAGNVVKLTCQKPIGCVFDLRVAGRNQPVGNSILTSNPPKPPQLRAGAKT